MRDLMELVGVCVLALAFSALHPAIGIGTLGLYAILLANSPWRSK